jgi:hypothetical protein
MSGDSAPPEPPRNASGELLDGSDPDKASDSDRSSEQSPSPVPLSLPPLLVDEEADPLDLETESLIPFFRFYWSS